MTLASHGGEKKRQDLKKPSHIELPQESVLHPPLGVVEILAACEGSHATGRCRDGSKPFARRGSGNLGLASAPSSTECSCRRSPMNPWTLRPVCGARALTTSQDVRCTRGDQPPEINNQSGFVISGRKTAACILSGGRLLGWLRESGHSSAQYPGTEPWHDSDRESRRARPRPCSAGRGCGRRRAAGGVSVVVLLDGCLSPWQLLPGSCWRMNPHSQGSTVRITKSCEALAQSRWSSGPRGRVRKTVCGCRCNATCIERGGAGDAPASEVSVAKARGRGDCHLRSCRWVASCGNHGPTTWAGDLVRLRALL